MSNYVKFVTNRQGMKHQGKVYDLGADFPFDADIPEHMRLVQMNWIKPVNVDISKSKTKTRGGKK